MLATTASETVRILKDTPELGIQLKENIRIIRAQFDPRSDYIRCQSAPENPIQLLVFKDEVIDSRNLSDEEQDMLIQDIVEESLAQGVLITRLRAMPPTLGASAKEAQWQPQPAIKVCMMTGLGKKEIERAGTIVRHAVTKVMTRKR